MHYVPIAIVLIFLFVIWRARRQISYAWTLYREIFCPHQRLRKPLTASEYVDPRDITLANTTAAGERSQALVSQGQVALHERRLPDAQRLFEQALEIDHNCVEAQLALIRLRYPGEHYFDLLSRLHQALQPSTYVEIGVGDGASLARVLPTTKAVGIDPSPSLGYSVGPNVRVVRAKSETFFAAPDVPVSLGFSQIDVGFIDGMHLFENVLSDFSFLERYAARTGIILIHDCLPFDAATSSRERRTRFWTGDVWRILPTLSFYRPDLSIALVKCMPSGLAIVRGLDPTSQVIDRQKDEMLAFGQALQFPAYSGESTITDSKIHVLASEWHGIESWLREPSARSVSP